MHEIFIVGYAKNSEKWLFGGLVATATKACGLGNVIGNKGAVQMYFNYDDKYFNFIATHLLHG